MLNQQKNVIPLISCEEKRLSLMNYWSKNNMFFINRNQGVLFDGMDRVSQTLNVFTCLIFLAVSLTGRTGIFGYISNLRVYSITQLFIIDFAYAALI